MILTCCSKTDDNIARIYTHSTEKIRRKFSFYEREEEIIFKSDQLTSAFDEIWHLNFSNCSTFHRGLDEIVSTML